MPAFVTVLYRKNINNKFCEQYITTFQKSDMDVQKFNEEKEKSVVGTIKKNLIFNLVLLSRNGTTSLELSI